MRPKNTPNDPERRERIVDAAIQLIRDGGTSRVTARAAAQQAGVPVGSVAYHFESVRALLIEASRRVLRSRAESLDEWLRGVTADTVVARLAELVHHHLTAERGTSVVTYELYVLGMRDPEFRAVSRASLVHLREKLAEVLPAPAADRLAATADGYQMQCLFEERTPPVENIRTMLQPD
ncbi:MULTISPECIES: TetR/AcrR family transcriptional regulator [unclassified Saccharopolyspora]|uniref:TetR/AcrR family transcriptional regulator n=1 Tax=unclassified Saccharopolyspora TaxID=2646250 RepID=UPI001CD1FA2E|nr:MULTISPECIES: TetR family transcriptional regulator [unclassified Saccharopolyspora]MCA1188186.1 TetR family transcriptional regulator [Saccharopolyspora sp. 6T]MCA1196307.1 TetR family transcriptional regulator [Saccharopolyspora sp. 6V]MCA1227918.1 TetR family transcriptional regulator [Saccharopolyspora sp. 6M]MCA1281205.1 TetR family transcriptional regulator [Saccharopolyspora sp. 7B]